MSDGSGFAGGSAARLQALLDAAVDAVVSIDEAGTILGCNKAAVTLFGYAADEIIGQPVNCLMPEPYRSEHGAYMQRYLAHGDARIIGIGREVRGRKRSGEVFPLYLSVGEAFTNEGREFVAVMRDLSAEKSAEDERRALEARLAEVARFSLMGEMAAGIAHEINQPLAAIANYAQAARRLLERGDTGSERLRKACEAINEQAARAGAVIDNLRGFLRKREITSEPLDVNRVAEDVMALIRTDAREAGIPLSVELAEGLPAVHGNATQLQQVLLNLTRNAVDAMTEASSRLELGIVVRTSLNDSGQVELSVTDHGPGVPSTFAEGIFHPFVSTKSGGLGVGLAISQRIVHAHGGTLSYRENPAGGAVFVASLPAREAGGE